MLTMLPRSSLPGAFWWLVADNAVYLLNRLPTMMALGYMSSYESVVRGRKCHSLKSKTDRRKDFDARAQ